MREVDVMGVRVEMPSNQPLVLLREVSGERYLPIWIGAVEATAIAFAQQGVVPPRPLTHDLMTDILNELGSSITRVTVTELRDNTFFALVTLRTDGSDIEIDSRPSDAIALAVRSNAPIFASDDLITESSIEFDEEPDEAEDMVAKFKEFLDDVSPDDFAL